MNSETETQKQLRRKFHGLKRIRKEFDGYKQEEDKQLQRIETMKQQNKDQHDIKKQQEVLEETRMMLPNVMQRLTEGLIDLEGFIDEYGEDEDIKDYEMKIEAQDTLNQMREFLDEQESKA